MRLYEIKTPSYVCESWQLRENLNILNSVATKSGAKIFCALKGFAFSPSLSEVAAVLNGATSSGLWESRYAKKHGFKAVCTYSPTFRDDEISEVINLSDHIVFNSLYQLDRFGDLARKSGVSVGIRINPQSSSSPTDMYNPCAPHSRLGVTKEMITSDDADSALNNLAQKIDGVHFHALCEESAQSLKAVLEALQSQFEPLLKSAKWVNFGGGHHITKKGYDTNLLIKLISEFRAKYGCEVILEPGEAVGWEAGFLIASVLDIVDNGGVKTAILDASAECHMPDTILMPYKPAIRGAIRGENAISVATSSDFLYRLAGATCLAGDVIGLAAGDPSYYFSEPLKIGDKIIFEDQLHYTIVKNTTFNGTRLPSLAVMERDGEVKIVKEFDSSMYEMRN